MFTKKSTHKFCTILTLFVFLCQSTIALGAGIEKGDKWEVGESQDFVRYQYGREWTLYAKDDKYGYLITTGRAGESQYNKTEKGNVYYDSELKNAVTNIANYCTSVDSELLNRADGYGKGYIVEHLIGAPGTGSKAKWYVISGEEARSYGNHNKCDF